MLPGRLDTKDYINFVSHADYLASRDFYVVAIDPPQQHGIVLEKLIFIQLQIILNRLKYKNSKNSLTRADFLVRTFVWWRWNEIRTYKNLNLLLPVFIVKLTIITKTYEKK